MCIKITSSYVSKLSQICNAVLPNLQYLKIVFRITVHEISFEEKILLHMNNIFHNVFPAPQ